MKTGWICTHCVVCIWFLPGLLGRAEAGGERLAVTGGQPARLLPAAERATGHHKHRCGHLAVCIPPSTNPQAPEWAGSHHWKVGHLQSDSTECIYRNQVPVPKSKTRNIFIILFYLYNSYEFELASGIIIFWVNWMNYTKLNSYTRGFRHGDSLGKHLILSHCRNDCHWLSDPYLLPLLQETLIGSSWGKWHN